MNIEKQSYKQLKSIIRLFIDYLWDSKKESYTFFRGMIWFSLSIISLSIPHFFMKINIYLGSHFLINHVEWKNIFIGLYFFITFLFAIGILIGGLCLGMFLINIFLCVIYKKNKS